MKKQLSQLGLLALSLAFAATGSAQQSGVKLQVNKMPGFAIAITAEGRMKYVGDVLEIHFTSIRLEHDEKSAFVESLQVSTRRNEQNFRSVLMPINQAVGKSALTLTDRKFRVAMEPASDDFTVMLIAHGAAERSAWLSRPLKVQAATVNACNDLIRVKNAKGGYTTFNIAEYVAQKGSAQTALKEVRSQLQRNTELQPVYQVIAAALACWD